MTTETELYSGCFGFRLLDHWLKDCPKHKAALASLQPTKSAPTPGAKGRGRGRCKGQDRGAGMINTGTKRIINRVLEGPSGVVEPRAATMFEGEAVSATFISR